MKIKIQSKDMMKMLGSNSNIGDEKSETLKGDPPRDFIIHNFCESPGEM